MKKLILLIVCLGLISYVGYLGYTSYLRLPKPILSPASPATSVPKRIVGFLPYWQMEAIDTLKFTLLDEVIYFGLGVTEKGEIVQRPSFAKLKEKLAGQKLTLALVLQDNEKVESFLKNQDAQKQLIENVSLLITQNPSFSGINIDFEYSGIPARETVTQYADFVSRFVNELKTKNPELIVSVDITADAMKKSRLYDVAKLAKPVDYVVLMGYDFYRATSDVAGPVAPLTGRELYDYDVTSAVNDFLTVVPKEKLILGVPYYGWDFPTVDESRGSFVEKRPDEGVALATYKRVQKLIEEADVRLQVDEESQTPWLTYRDAKTGGIRQIWYEDETSLSKKYDLVKKEDLAGITIWALGYDGAYPELWQLLKTKFR